MIEFGSNHDFLKTPPFLILLTDTDNKNLSGELRIRIALPTYGKKGEDLDGCLGKVKDILSESVPVYPDCNKIYEIVFSKYQTYQVIGEVHTSFNAMFDENNVGKGRFFIEYEKSSFLDNGYQIAEKNPWGNCWRHFCICTETHVIHIISEQPTITQI